MKHINIKALFPGCGKSHVLMNLYLNDTFSRKYYITPQNKQCADITESLRNLGCINPKVSTVSKFLGNWQAIKVEDQLFYIMTENVSDRAPTKKQIDLFIDEYSSISKKTIDLIVSKFNIRNLFTAGDSHQFDPIEYHSIVYKNGSRTEIAAEYHDKGELPDLPIDTQIVLTKSMRSLNDDNLMRFINDIKLAKANNIFTIIANRIYDKTKKPDDLHIAYTNDLINKINTEYSAFFDSDKDKQYIVKENDKKFGLLKGTLLNRIEYEAYVNLKRNVFENLLSEGEIKDVDDELNDWKTRMFGYAYAVTSHKLQGATIKDRRIIIHLSDMIKYVSAVRKDKSMTDIEKANELERRLDVFHKLLYVAVSRATTLNQIYFADDIDDDDDKEIYPINFLKSYLDLIKPFNDLNVSNAIETTSDTFDYIAFLNSDVIDSVDYKSFNEDIARDALNMSFKEWSAKHQLSSGTWKRLRAKCKPNMGSRNVTYKETLPDPLLTTEVVSSNEDNSTMYTISKQSPNPLLSGPLAANNQLVCVRTYLGL